MHVAYTLDESRSFAEINMTIAMWTTRTGEELDYAMRRGEERSIRFQLHRAAREADPVAYARWRADVEAARMPAPAEPCDPDAELEAARRRWEALDARLAASALWDHFANDFTFSPPSKEDWDEYAQWSEANAREEGIDFAAEMEDFEANERAVWAE
jgi:hypothetical protein